MPEPADTVSITQHSITLNGERINYTAHAGWWTMKQEREKDGASAGEQPALRIFFVAYLRDGAPDRPITFSFNGGPGSSSVWMHLGLLGPRRVVMGDAGALTPPPWGLADNPHSLLAHSDLVFIDPAGTGYSRVVEGEKTTAYYSFEKDIESVGDFIRLFCTRHKRWGAPKFVIGESYGTTRAAALAQHLQGRHGLALNGIMLVSNVLNFQTVRFAPGNDLPYVLYLPTYAACAWYHKRIDARRTRALGAVIAEARAFANGDFARALAEGDALSAAAERDIARRVAALTGVGERFVLQCNLRMTVTHFSKELLRDQGLWIGRLDGRFTSFDPGGDHPINFEPSSNAYNGPYSAAIHTHLREALRCESDLPYEIMNMKINFGWSWHDFDGRFVDATNALRITMCQNPALRILVCNGYYDLATPFHASEYAMNHLHLPRALRGNIRHTYYDAGHLMYVHAPSLVQQARDLADFVNQK